MPLADAITTGRAGEGTMTVGAWAAATVAAVVSAVSYIGSGRLSVFGGAAMFGTVFLYRGLRQSRAVRK